MEVIRLWIQINLSKIKSANRKYSSYGLKHICERDHLANPIGNYVSNDEFIEAMKLEGYKLFPILGTPNYHFNCKLVKRV